MSHLDEGTLHALLDGELDLHEVREIQAHLGSCTACDSRFQAAKDVYSESDRLVASVQFPGALKGMKQAEAAAPAAEAPPPPLAASAGKKRRIEAKPVTNAGAPQVVILPEQNEWPERRRRWVTSAKWAAVLFVALGAGFLASEARKNSDIGGSSIRAADSEEPNWIVSQDEMTEAESLSMASAGADKRATAYRATGERAAPPAPSLPPQKKPELKAASRKDTAAEDTAADLAKTAGTLEPREEQIAETDGMEPEVAQENIRAEAAEALAQLDAQRRRERAAAATAAIDRAKREAVARQSVAAPAQVQPAAAPPPPPPTLEQRSGIYLRIGLDEAARQLGRPVHVIEGMSAQFMGLVQGSQVPGADDNRPAVRVVYQDSQDRMILLDQQRVRAGQTWPSTASQWAVGEIGLALHGDPPGEVLRNLRPRVR
jgi:anti-sigma factor RsiW